MKKNCKAWFICAFALFAAFAVFTVLAAFYDVKPVGPDGSEVGFAALNLHVFQKLGAHMQWYDITEYLGYLALAVAATFGATGLFQLVKRRSIRRVDRQILVLGVFYVLVLCCYVFFEVVVINFRPVLVEGQLEASYPSSHTVLTVCIMGTAALQLHSLLQNKKLLRIGAEILAVLIAGVTVVGRLLSGVHWFTDIVGGLLLSAALLTLYAAVSGYVDRKKNVE
jgi:undecaprenyl-diphosphatase